MRVRHFMTLAAASIGTRAFHNNELANYMGRTDIWR
jgi:hypothetical protein